MFRTVAEAQMRREQQKRSDVESQLNPPATQYLDPREVAVPPSIFPPGPLGPASPATRAPFDPRGDLRPNSPATNPRATDSNPRKPPSRPPQSSSSAKPNTLTVKTREAAAFVENLVKFNASIDPLVEELRRGTATNPAIRSLVPDAFRVTADTRALLGRCDGLEAPQTLLDPYCDLDRRWRQLSFELRFLDGLSPTCTTSIRDCDRWCSLMARQLGVQPQFDRERLRQVMLTAATYMQSLMDDLSISSLPPADRDTLVRDVRLLRQQLLTECNNANDANYETIVTRFTDFVGRWQRVAARVAAVRDPHVQMRLDRIGECGTETYALMWMPPLSPQLDLRAEAARLEKAFGVVLEQLSMRAMASLTRDEEARIVTASRQLDGKCGRLVELAEQRAPLQDLASLVVDIDTTWNSIRGKLVSLPTVDRNSIAEMDRVCGGLRQGLGEGGSVSTPSLDYESLLMAAASLEGSMEYFRADVQRYERYLQPSTYRDAITRAAIEMHEAAKQLHLELGRRGDLPSLQRSADTIAQAFDRISHDLEDVERHGLTGSRAATLERSRDELLPLVAQIAAALLDH